MQARCVRKEKRVFSGGVWEEKYGYARAVIAGERVIVSGCTATVDGVVQDLGDPYQQSMTAMGIALEAVQAAGLTREDVVMVRYYVVEHRHFDLVGRAIAEILGHVRPACTGVRVAGLVDVEMLIEIEIAARLGYETIAIARGGDREKLALNLGAHHYIDSDAQPPRAALKALGGADLIVYTASAPADELLTGLNVHGQLTLIDDAPSVRDAGGAADTSIEAQIRAVYDRLVARPGAWVSLTDLRQLVDAPREQVDQALRALERRPDVNLVPESNQKTLRPADRAAAVNIGDQDKHLIWFDPDT